MLSDMSPSVSGPAIRIESHLPANGSLDMADGLNRNEAYTCPLSFIVHVVVLASEYGSFATCGEESEGETAMAAGDSVSRTTQAAAGRLPLPNT
ncbi:MULTISPECIES: hypothetical protein [Burkholderia]|uniref:Uncharacterized protein n=2 Tax=Burkholderiaceae TaxID=119060 RepID=A0AAP1V2D9_9BURK|nr:MULTISPECIES: hypothetical protein [Burkholderia]MBH9690280.1 hypothetical protein [Burkholderia contaminans]MBK1900838.1 hypothetical protein [Burkholderia contaminans]MBK1908367.1 hypothetical protein [Burkholderia contaminans]MBK1923163.1 hypothetical protein [Burkholderia contaminans]MBK1930281.1 hypothetical protein [Burkholderia contaminans]